jgi:hypothetical protein
MASAAADTWVRIRDAMLSVIETQTEAWVAAGCPPDFSIDGESYSWAGWLAARLAELEKVEAMIQHKRPYYVRSRMRG